MLSAGSPKEASLCAAGAGAYAPHAVISAHSVGIAMQRVFFLELMRRSDLPDC